MDSVGARSVFSREVPIQDATYFRACRAQTVKITFAFISQDKGEFFTAGERGVSLRSCSGVAHGNPQSCKNSHVTVKRENLVVSECNEFVSARNKNVKRVSTLSLSSDRILRESS